ncbi:MAG: sigma-70 family RNA polymerase sigma factor [Actinobacteria bacterium]|nr:sigma-70 family RNA polymerase sigma factor [Actinomycetota bacterium]
MKRAVPPHPGIDPVEWASLLATRSPEGTVDADDVAHVLRNVELDEDLIRQIEAVLRELNIEQVAHEPIVAAATETGPRRSGTTARAVRRGLAHTPVGDTADAVRLYLHEIGQIELLTAEDERILGRAIQAMHRARAEMGAATVSPSRRRELRADISKGTEALDHLITANLRLVVSIARRYDGRDLLLADLIQEGNIGLMRAAEKYDWEKGFKFSTYATWWIRQAMMRAMADQGRTIRVPSHVVELINRLHKTERDLMAELKREPTVAEIAARTLIDAERIEELRQISVLPVSLDAPIGSDEDSATWGENVSLDDEGNSPADLALRKQLIEAISAELDHLPERDRRIIERRFGIHTGEPQTLDDVAKQEGVTRERIRQIEQKTLARLRHPNNSRRLRAFLDD